MCFLIIQKNANHFVTSRSIEPKFSIFNQMISIFICLLQIKILEYQLILLKNGFIIKLEKCIKIISKIQIGFQINSTEIDFQTILINLLQLMIRKIISSPISKFPSNKIINPFCSSASYQSRKQVKRLQMQNQIFKPQTQRLIQRQLNAQFLVPNFFTSKLTIKKFPFINMGSKTINSFLNSYNCMYLPLGTNIKLREKLNKLFDNQVRTGRIFQIMDSVAGLVSYQHCYGTLQGKQRNSMICVTGSIQSFYMFQRIDIKKDLEIKGYLNAVGKTSMEIQIYLQQEGKIKANSIFTMIARNAQNPLKGYTVPTLDFTHLNQTQLSKALQRQSLAKQNVQRRKIQIENSYDKKPPTQDEVSQLHQIFLSRKDYLVSTQNSTPIDRTIIENSQIMHTQERNVHGKIFGGFLIREMVQLGWVAACKYSQEYVIVQDLTNIYFKKPVDIGCRLTLKSKVTYVQNNRLVITVQAFTAKFTQKKESLACTLNFIAKSNNKLRPVHPESYQDGLLYLSSKKAYCELFY